MTPNRGFFLTIEGIEGAGKSTLAEALANRIASSGQEVVVTREPGGGQVSETIRKLLLNAADTMCDRTELLLFEAARAQHVDDVIGPALARGAVVICDRFADSSLAYQSYARGVDFGIAKTLNDFATHGLKPDLTILLDLPAEVGLGRQREVDRISSEGLAFHESVRRGYLSIAAVEPDRFTVIDATHAFDKVLEQASGAIMAARAEVV